MNYVFTLKLGNRLQETINQTEILLFITLKRAVWDSLQREYVYMCARYVKWRGTWTGGRTGSCTPGLTRSRISHHEFLSSVVLVFKDLQCPGIRMTKNICLYELWISIPQGYRDCNVSACKNFINSPCRVRKNHTWGSIQGWSFLARSALPHLVSLLFLKTYLQS